MTSVNMAAKKENVLIDCSISNDNAYKAVMRLNNDNDDLNAAGYEYILIGDDRSVEVIDMFRDHYLPDETASRAIGLTLNDELKDIILAQIKQNLSIGIMSTDTRKIVAWQIMSIANKNDEKACLEEEKNQQWFDILHFEEDESNIYQRYDVESAVYVTCLCTHRGFRGHGLGNKIMLASTMYLKNLGFEGGVMFGEGSAKHSQRIFDKCGFETIFQLLYSDYKVNGEIIFSNTGEEATAKLYAKII